MDAFDCRFAREVRSKKDKKSAECGVRSAECQKPPCTNGKARGLASSFKLSSCPVRLSVSACYRVPTVAASRDCEDLPTLVQLGLLRAHGHDFVFAKLDYTSGHAGRRGAPSGQTGTYPALVGGCACVTRVNGARHADGAR
eukprot:7349038-Prymnesium_polylepis.1